MDIQNYPILPKSRSRWIVAYTRSRKEKVVERNLTDKAITVFLPMKKQLRQWSDRKKLVVEPLFRSYIFVYANNKEYYNAVCTEGIVRFLCCQGQPLEVSEREMCIIRRAANCSSSLEVCAEKFCIGDNVIITKGTFIGITGILVEFKGRHRVAVQLDSLELTLMVEVPLSAIKKL